MLFGKKMGGETVVLIALPGLQEDNEEIQH